ncbi:MAG: hypothetical protein LBN96_07130 [Desulfovibrio sp.]|nr:hypothetical protein [Desulfovibrio sp.]
MGAVFFYALLCGIICLPLLICGLGWFSYNIFKENYTLRESILRFEEDFQKAQSIAERLENIEELLDENSVAGKDILLRRLAASSETDSASPSGAQADSADENRQAPQSPKDTPQETVPTISTDDYIKVENVQARALRENKLRIALDLRNADTRKIAVGRVSVVLLTADGSRHEPVFVPHNVGDFRISRFKRTVMRANLAHRLNLVNAQVILEVRREDDSVVYRNLFAVER